jgi:zinc protease
MNEIEIPFVRHILSNGLRLVVHRDPKTPVVTVSVWYHVGSKNETEGRTGFAHLFEHLMFEGSEHHDGEYFRPLEAAGASVINGTTSRDRTNYFQTVPVNALDLALWLESDRMGHLLGVMTQEKLDEQREVVRNEKKQSENQPYGRVSELLSRSLYPKGHPYSWPIIGSIDDLDAASLNDVRGWFETFYRPNNAVLVVSGDVDPEQVLETVERHFGAIQPGPPLERPGVRISELDDARRVTLEDRVPQARVYRAWNVPPVYDDDYHRLALLTKVLSVGKSSRLFSRLVHRDQIATDAAAYLWSGEIGSSFVVQATCAPGVEPEQVESALDQELARLREAGPQTAEVERARNRTLAAFLRGLQRTGGSGGKSEVLAHGEIFRGTADAYRESLGAIQRASAEDLHRASERWLSRGSLTLTVAPVPTWTGSDISVDRSRAPAPGDPPRPKFPSAEVVTLSNGLEVRFVPWGELPLTHLTYLADAGFAADRAAGMPSGTASLTMKAMDEGTQSRSGPEISDAIGSLGSRLATSAGLDSCRISLASLSERLDESLEIWVDVIRNPSFPEEEIERLKREQLARIARERATPVQLALRVLPSLLYGDGHPYATPFTGSGSETDVEATTREATEIFHRRWLGPDRSTLLCVGNPDRERLVEHLDKGLGDWPVPDGGGAKEIPDSRASNDSRILLLDRPDAIQSIVFGGQVLPPRGHPDEAALELFNHAFGGAFTSRLNLNLREDKGWTYGAHSLLWSARGQRPFLVYSSVQTDRTADSIREMRGELEAMVDSRPITEDELQLARASLIGSLPAQWETLADLAAALGEIAEYGLPETYWDDSIEQMLSLGTGAVSAGAARWIDPEGLVWVVVGDLSVVRPEIEALGLGAVEVITDG